MMGGRSPLSYLSTPLVSLLSFLPIQYLQSNLGDAPSIPRLEVTSDRTIRCGIGGGRMISGYAHLGNGSMYWLFFPSGNEEVKGLTLHHNGGPASSMDYPFLGAGPCQLTPEGELVQAPHPWTDVTNLLIVDMPLGAGWSYAHEPEGVASDSAWAAGEVDDVLQLFLEEYPQFIPEALTYHSLSYGGTYVPHVLDKMRHRNAHGGPDRIRKEVDHVLLTNPFADIMTHMRWSYNSSCQTEPHLYPSEICTRIRDLLPACQDSLDIALANSTIENRLKARSICVLPEDLRSGGTLRNPVDRRKPKCESPSDCHWWWNPLPIFLNKPETKTLLGVKEDLTWTYVGKPAFRFLETADNMQAAYTMLQPALKTGTKLTVMSALPDTVCPWQGNLAWMGKLPNPHVDTFRQSPIKGLPPTWPTGWSKGENGYQMIALDHGSHILELDQAEVMQRVIGRMVRGEQILEVV